MPQRQFALSRFVQGPVVVALLLMTCRVTCQMCCCGRPSTQSSAADRSKSVFLRYLVGMRQLAKMRNGRLTQGWVALVFRNARHTATYVTCACRSITQNTLSQTSALILARPTTRGVTFTIRQVPGTPTHLLPCMACLVVSLTTRTNCRYSFNSNNTELQKQLSEIFMRDWNSPYAHPL